MQKRDRTGKRQKLIAGICALSLLVVVVFAATPLVRFPRPGDTPAVSNQAQQETAACFARIGVVHPLTAAYLKGPATESMRGYELARDLINSEGGIKGCQVQLVIKDDGGIAERSRVAAIELIDQDQVPVLLSTLLSDGALAMAREANKRNTPLLISNSNDPLITNLGFEWVFRVPSDTEQIVRTTFDYLATQSDLGQWPSLGVIYDDSFVSTTMATILSDRAAANGFSILASEHMNTSATDLRRYVARVARAHPDVLFLTTTSTDQAVELVNQIGASGWVPKITFGILGPFNTLEFAERVSYPGRLLTASSWATDFETEGRNGQAAQEIARLFQERYGVVPSETAALSATAAFIAAYGLLVSTSETDVQRRSEVRQALRDLYVPDTGIGAVKFDQRGQNVVTPLLLQVAGGKMSTVFPDQRQPIDPAAPSKERR